MLKGLDALSSKLFGKDLDRTVFYIAILLTAPFVATGLFIPHRLAAFSQNLVSAICNAFQSTYLLSISSFLIFCILIAVSPWGKIKLGSDEESPEFSTLSWFSMLFSAGMGIGLLFWSIAEPMSHLNAPPVQTAGVKETAILAQQIYFFHWGVHPWAVYSIVALFWGYSRYRKKRGGLISGCLVPIFGERLCSGTFGKVVDAFSVWAILFGVVTGMGTGAMQIGAGISSLFGFQSSPLLTSLCVLFITGCFIISASTGLSRGIKLLSWINILLMATLLVYFVIFGPTAFLAENFLESTFSYFRDLPAWSVSTSLFDNESWTRNWTVFYWAFWIAWAPFVGGFIARISRGRTIREFILMTLVVPVIFSFIFSSALGGTGLFMELQNGIDISGLPLELALFETLRHMTGGLPLSLVTILLATTFVISSADSATYVMIRLCTHGREPADPGARRRMNILWGTLIGLLTVGFILSDGLSGLKSATIIGSVPFLAITLLSIVALVISLLQETSSGESAIPDLFSRLHAFLRPERFGQEASAQQRR